MKRLTLDIPTALHRAIKTQCVAHGTTIVEELRALLAEKYGNQKLQKGVKHALPRFGIYCISQS